MGKTNLILFAIFIVSLSFGVTRSAAQTPLKSVGNIELTIKSTPLSSSGLASNYDVPVNEKYPLLRGVNFRVESSHGGDLWEIDSVALADKNNPGQALLKVTLIVHSYRGKKKVVQKKLKLKKTQSRKFSLKFNGLDYEFTANYKT